MDRVYKEDGGYTNEANVIEKKVIKSLRELIRNELEAGTSIEGLEYVLTNGIRKEILTQTLYIRLGKDVNGAS